LLLSKNEFGDYLRKLRLSKQVTQEQLAVAVQRHKMTISQIESGKNDPPQGDLLENIIQALGTTSEEANELRDLSALARDSIPIDILDYFKNNSGLRAAIRRAKSKDISGIEWEKLFQGETI
jgi:transcriptional regulator with XRE-family HTH domain